MLEHLSTFLLIFSFLIIFFYKKEIIKYQINDKNNISYVILFIIFFQILFWFHTSPVVRFGFHYVLLFFFFILILVFKNFVIKKNYINFILIIYIGLSINSQKNIFRIYPHKITCNNIIKDRCLLYDLNNIYYIDDNHPSLFFSKLIALELINVIYKINNY